MHPADEDDDDVGNISSKVLPTTAKSPSINSTASMVKFKSPVKSKRKRAVIEENVEAASKEMNEADISMEIFGDDSDNDEVEVVNDHSHQSTSGNMIVEEDVDAARAAKKLRKQEKRERRAKRRLKKMRLSEATQAHNGANISMETLDDNDDEEVDITDDYTYLDNSGVMIDSVVKDEDDDDDEAARIAKKLRKQERRERRERKRLKKLRQSEEAV